MLVEINVANFRSFKEQQTFSLVKGKGDELLNQNVFTATANKDIALLNSAAIYGPNASGKSNFLVALQCMRRIVLDSSNNSKRGDKLPVTPFKLSKENRALPSEFEVTFIIDHVRYQYGFAATENRVIEEWLFAYPKGRAQRWLGRSWRDKSQTYDWELGSHLQGERQLWQKSTRDNALFLSTAVQLNSEQLQPLYDWFNNTLRFANVGGWNANFTASLCEMTNGKSQKSKILAFLKAADLNIDDVLVERRNFDSNELPQDMPDSMRDMIARDFSGKQVLDVKTVHKDSSGENVVFDFDEESDGTQKLFSFAGPWLDSLEKGHVLFIDELHDNLHPKLVQFLVSLFHSKEINLKNAQLVFTTHETSILNQDVFRRDQIWFCEKDKNSASALFPLTDFSPRKGRENLELAYLSGRYGAVPFLGSLEK